MSERRNKHKERVIAFIIEREERRKLKEQKLRNGHSSLAAGLLAEFDQEEPCLEKKKRIDS